MSKKFSACPGVAQRRGVAKSIPARPGKARVSSAAHRKLRQSLWPDAEHNRLPVK
ncbi:MAG: hypothetical protein IMZ61_01320 [Planctomycetes bacterium]|nr:hypothetical protein [Planctomycetota bacterium]